MTEKNLLNQEEEEVKYVDEDEAEEGEVIEVKKSNSTKSANSTVNGNVSKPLTKDEEVIINSAMDNNENLDAEKVKFSAVDMLVKFKNFISSDNFDQKVNDVSRKYNVDKCVVKNKFIKGFLGTVADVLNLTISITGDILVGAVRFINSIIKNIVNFASATLHKLVNLITLNCGTVVL